MKHICITILSIFCFSATFSQYNISSGGSVYTCGGTFTDSGGSGGDYGVSEDYVFTICPGASETDDVIRMTFTQFCVESAKKGECTDILYLYQGDAAYYAASGDAGVAPTSFDDSYCGTTNPVIIATSASGCLTFRFISSDKKNQCGWSANISCQTPCQTAIASLASIAPLSICPASALNPGTPIVSFDASGSSEGGYSSGPHNDSGDPNFIEIDEYVFDWGDGTSTTNTTDGTETHSYTTPGVYKVSVSVTDNNTDIYPNGCPSTNAVTRDIAVTTEPAITEPSTTANCGGCVNLDAIGETRTVSEAPPTVNASPTSLPDGDGNSWVNSVDYGGYFPDGSVVTSGCYPTVCFEIDHSYVGDLTIELVAPTGEVLLLWNRQGGDVNFGDCTPPLDDGAAGCGRTYCWVDGGAATIPVDAGTACGGCPTGETGNFAVAGTYAPFGGNFNTLDGADLNGSWSLRVTDNLNLDDGTLHGWSMTFPTACYKTLTEISPSISTVTWNDTSPFTSTGGSSSGIAPAPGDPCPAGATCDGTTVNATGNVCYAAGVSGNFNYNFTVEDEFGCQYAGQASVVVTCALASDNLVFSGKNDGAVNTLNWVVFESDQYSSYEIERMTANSSWELINKTNSNNSKAYIYHDRSFDIGDNYYRVKGYDQTGVVDISDVIVIDNRNNVKNIKRVYNVYGQEVPITQKGLLIIEYGDGTIEKKYIK